MRYFNALGIVVILGSLCLPSWAGLPYNVDDPGTTEPHHVILDLSYVSSSIQGSEVETLPSANIAYGLNDTVELDLGLNAISMRNTGSDRVSGLGDTFLFVRKRFVEETARRPQLLFAYQIKLPTASRSQGLGSGKIDHMVWLSAAKSYGKYYVFGNCGCNILGDPAAKNNVFYGLGVTYQTTEKLTIGAQVYGNTASAPGARDELAYGIGLRDNYLPDQTFQVQVGRSAHGLSDLNVFAGVEFVFGPKAAPETPPAPVAATAKP